MPEWSDDIWASLDKTIREIDASILTLSSATLVLSVTFIEKVGKTHLALVERAWWFLIAAVILTLLSRFVSAVVHALLTPGALRSEAIGEGGEKAGTYLIWALNTAALVTFVTGLVFLIRFATVNLEVLSG